jgi:peptide/nickel transport system permease protein
MATYAEPTGTTAIGVKPRRASWLRRIAWRILGAIFVIWAAATFVFFVQQLLPGNQATLILNEQTGNQQSYTHHQLAPTEAKYGLDEPVLTQYFDYIKGLAHGDLGKSYTQHKAVSSIISEQVGPTLVLTVTALVLAWIFALATILLTARRKKKVVSSFGSGWEIFSAGLPYYWLGVILLVVFAIELKIFPVTGGTSISGLVLPALTLAIPLAGFLGQVTRDEFEKVLDQPFVTSARARGMGDLAVRFKHVLRHAVPAVTLSGWALGALISGAVIVETVFARPGIGQMIVGAAEHRDVPLVSGVVLLVAAIYVVANILVDIAYAIIDPRLRG